MVHVASLALWQSTTLFHGILLSGRRSQVARRPQLSRSPWHSSRGYLLSCLFVTRLYTSVCFHPFATASAFGSGSSVPLWALSPQFYPPVCYQPSLAEGSQLLRVHLSPYTTSSLPCLSARLSLPSQLGWYRASPGKSACLNMNPSVLTP